MKRKVCLTHAQIAEVLGPLVLRNEGGLTKAEYTDRYYALLMAMDWGNRDRPYESWVNGIGRWLHQATKDGLITLKDDKYYAK